jgi:hypothetical protein
MTLDPKRLNPYVTNLELWLLLAVGFVMGRWPSWWGFAAACLGALVIDGLWRPHCGLDQWPAPRGRYYREWLKLKGAGDYYEWLASKMGNREPWATWKRLARELDA